MKWFKREDKKCQRCWRVNDSSKPFGHGWLCARHYEEVLRLMVEHIPYEKEYEPHQCECCKVNLGWRKDDRKLFCTNCQIFLRKTKDELV